MGSPKVLLALLSALRPQFSAAFAQKAKADAKANAKKPTKAKTVNPDPWQLGSSQVKKDYLAMTSPPLSIFAYVPAPLRALAS